MIDCERMLVIFQKLCFNYSMLSRVFIYFYLVVNLYFFEYGTMGISFLIQVMKPSVLEIICVD